MSTESEEQRTTSIPGRCDICNQRDGFNGHNLQQCLECGVLVHETCNGMPSTPSCGKLDNWTCLACQSVGQTFRGRQQLGHQSDGCWDDCEVKQEERPKVCALCAIKSGNHAMHPLYDMPGSLGRQVVNKSGKLVWVHTLCGMYHGVHTKMVYGCDKDGNSDDSNIEEDAKKGDGERLESIIGSKVIEWEFASPPPVLEEEEQPSEDSKKSSTEEDAAVEVAATAWFVIGGKETGEWAEWAKETRNNIMIARKEVCIYCEKTVNGLRIPVTCSAGSKDEPGELSGRRKNAHARCTTAMHVGCARWGRKKNNTKYKARRLFYTPGKEAGSFVDENDTKAKRIAETAVACYCSKHATEIKEIFDRNKKLKAKKRNFAALLEEEEEEEHDDEETSRSEQETMSNDAIADTSSGSPSRKNEKNMSENSQAHQQQQELASEQEDCPGDRASQLPILNPPQQMEEDADSSDDERSLEYKPPGSTRALGFSADDHDGGGGEADASAAEKVNPRASIREPGGKILEFGDWNASDDEDQVNI